MYFPEKLDDESKACAGKPFFNGPYTVYESLKVLARYFNMSPSAKFEIACVECDAVNTVSDGIYSTTYLHIINILSNEEKEKELCYGSNLGCFNEGNYNVGDFNKGNKNIGEDNEGSSNIGNKNIGNSNIGDRNVGNGNIGSCNKGSNNHGGINIGDDNVGDNNKGVCNVGFGNEGDSNRGYSNIGSYNIGGRNKGDKNFGSYNVGWGNNGHYNIGDLNNGSSNVGFNNRGSSNVGDNNNGIFNVGYGRAGIFNTEFTEGYFMFNKPLSSEDDEKSREAVYLLSNLVEAYLFGRDGLKGCLSQFKDNTVIDIIKISPEDMMTGNVLDIYTNYNLVELVENIMNLPNFDDDVFEFVMGFKLDDIYGKGWDLSKSQLWQKAIKQNNKAFSLYLRNVR